MYYQATSSVPMPLCLFCPVLLACAALQTLAGKIQEYIKAVAQLARLYYVERCHKTFVVNAPAWFGLSFRVVSPFLSARTRQKIRILGSDLTALQDEIDPQVGGIGGTIYVERVCCGLS